MNPGTYTEYTGPFAALIGVAISLLPMLKIAHSAPLYRNLLTAVVAPPTCTFTPRKGNMSTGCTKTDTSCVTALPSAPVTTSRNPSSVSTATARVATSAAAAAALTAVSGTFGPFV